jgi:hypothetical protein
MAGRTLTVFLAADTSRFRQGMATAGQSASGFRGRINNLANTASSMLGPAMAGAALAAGAFAVKMGVDGVKAAIDQEAKLAALDGTLAKMGWTAGADDAKKLIDELARITLFNDEDLIKPLEDMAIAIGGENGLNKAMAILPGLLDASQKSGKDLPSLITAAARAANGNEGALRRMFPWLKDSADGTLDFEDAMRQLAERFEGGAIDATNTMGGKLSQAAKAFEELKESFGVGFLDGIGTAEDAIGEEGITGTLYDLQDTMNNFGGIGEFFVTVGKVTAAAQGIHDSFTDWRDTLKNTPWGTLFGIIEKALNPLKTMVEGLVSGLLEVLRLTGLAKEVGTPNLTSIDTGSLVGRPVNLGGGSARTVTEQQVGAAISNVIAKTDARRGYVVGGVLR